MEHETCDACGFDGARFDDDALVVAIRALGPAWRALLAAAGDALRTRPADGVWSALEYAAHSRDITAVHLLGVDYALTTDDATVPPLGDGDLGAPPDADVNAVLDAIDRETGKLAQLAEDHPGSWNRTLTIGDAAPTPVRRLLEHALHDSMHHLDDVERGLAQIRL